LFVVPASKGIDDAMKPRPAGERHRGDLRPRLDVTRRRSVNRSVQRRTGCCHAVVALTVLALVATATAVPSGASDNAQAILARPLNSLAHCPWVGESRDDAAPPTVLAGEVLSKMSLIQKAQFVTLEDGGGVENFNAGVPQLCIPPLTLSDGPDGLAGRIRKVTRLPAAIGVAASFDPTVARDTGQVEGEEARTKGIDVVQGPDLNLARVPFSGRIFESYGEDPFLTSVMGVANIEGIQSEGVMALAKHFSAYTQETARTRLDQDVPVRALAELYNEPFEQAVQVAHVAGLMCSVGSLNGVTDCADPYIYATLHSWGFTGFVRSDEHAAPHPARAFAAGLDLDKPEAAASLARLVLSGALPVSDLNRAVRTVLIAMFTYGLIAYPRRVYVERDATGPAHQRVARLAAEASVVLLKDSNGILPLAKNVPSIAVIGSDASTHPVSTGGGSSLVRTTFVISPLAAIEKTFGATVRVRYAPGGPSSLQLDQFSDADVVSGKPLGLQKHIHQTGEAGKADFAIDSARNVTPYIATAGRPGKGPNWDHWRLEVRARRTGTYEVSLQQIGDTWLYFNGHKILSSRGLHAPVDIATTVRMRKGYRYHFGAKWFVVRHHASPTFGIEDVTPQIRAAVALARRSSIAIIFAGDFTTEGADRSSLSLPGDEDALISAVAAANHHTIVVLNTGGAVLMPWLRHVAAVLEAWYPGAQDGVAITSVLSGAVDPSGRLPLTFPAGMRAQPTTSVDTFPGVDSIVDYGTATSALDVGYRWYQAHGVTPLFPFGYGLDYTTFNLSSPQLIRTPTAFDVRVQVTNTGKRAGADVVQAYVGYPPSAGEPPEQLRAFARVVLAPSSSRDVTMALPYTSFESYLNGSFQTVEGLYSINMGQSSADLSLHLHVLLGENAGTAASVAHGSINKKLRLAVRSYLVDTRTARRSLGGDLD
jgi:beta-glucosidase